MLHEKEMQNNVKTKQTSSQDIACKLLCCLKSELNSFLLKNLFLVALEQLGDSLEEIWGSTSGGNMLPVGSTVYGVKSIRSKKKDWNINPNPINRSLFREIQDIASPNHQARKHQVAPSLTTSLTTIQKP